MLPRRFLILLTVTTLAAQEVSQSGLELNQFLPDRVDAEPAALILDVAEKLRAMGHTLNPPLRSQGVSTRL